MRIGKPQSKRTPVRLRHKIQKASNAKQRKQRKEAKKNPQWKSRVKKDPGIPNLFPYKAKVLAEIEENKRRKEEEQLRRREVAKAQREGRAVGEVDGVAATTAAGGALVDEEGHEILVDEGDMEDFVDDEGMDVEDDGANPMAALLASARERADAYTQDDEDDGSEDDEEEEEEEEGVEWTGITETPKASKSVDPAEPKAKGLPKQALDDPIKTCTKLLQQMQQTQDGIQRMIDYYQMPPLVTAGSNLPTRFLVEVARKRGRLGKGGVPNLHSAALTVLGDLNEGRLILPAVQTVAVEQKKTASKSSGANKGQVTVVEKMAEPFRLEGLWGGDDGGVKVVEESEMVVEP